MYRLVNLTPHDINIYGDGSLDDKDKVLLTLPSKGIARCDQIIHSEGYIGLEETLEDGRHISIPILRSSYGRVTGLPAPTDKTIYVVSALVAQQAKRNDVVCPIDYVRDEKNRIIGCRGFSRV